MRNSLLYLFREVKISENSRPKSCAQLAIPVVPSQAVEHFLYPLQTAHVPLRSCLTMGFASVPESVSAKLHVNLSQLASLPLGWVGGNWKKPQHIPEVWTSFHPLLLQWNVFSQVCLVKHPFTSVCFRRTLLHLFVPAKHHPTKLTFQRTLKFSLH